MSLKENSKRNLKIYIAIAVIVALVIGFLHRGYFRLKLLEFLHSFDDDQEMLEEDFSDSSREDIHSDAEYERERIELLRSLGYVSMCDENTDQEGVTVFDSSSTYSGYNLILERSASDAQLLDMNGEVIYSWKNDEITREDLWPESISFQAEENLWRRCHLSENGDLTVLMQHGGIFKLDKASNIVWISEFINAHHDMDFDEEGNIYALGRELHVNDRYFPDNLIVEDFLVILDSLGYETGRISILDALENSFYCPIINQMSDSGDVLHCNTVFYIRDGVLPDGYTGPLRPGSVILASRATHYVFALDLEEESIYWAESSFWCGPHDPTVLPDGSLLVFDNRGRDDASSIIRLDPATREVIWIYTGNDSHPFYSKVLGTIQYLPNGNILVVESTKGRAFEVNKDGDIVWEYHNPYRSPEDFELTAIVIDVTRIPYDYTSSWLHI
jgi:hypothetical protein